MTHVVTTVVCLCRADDPRGHDTVPTLVTRGEGGREMNVLQRIILIAGAITLAVVLYMTPSYEDFPTVGLTFKPTGDTEMYTKKDVGRAGINGSIVIGSTTLLFFASTSRKRKTTE